MQIDITDEKLQELVEKEISRCVAKKVEDTMNNGKAYWFSQQNIENLTRDIILRQITSDTIKQICGQLKTEEFIRRLSECIVNQFNDFLYEQFYDEGVKYDDE